MAGLLGGAAIRAEASTNSSSPSLNAGQLADSSTPDKHSCKGKGGCATDGSKS